MTYEIHSEIYIYPHLPNTPINLDKYTKIFEDLKAQFLDLDLQYCSYATRHEILSEIYIYPLPKNIQKLEHMKAQLIMSTC